MAKSNKDIRQEAQDAYNYVQKEAELRKEINSSYDSFIENVKQYSEIQKTHNKNLERYRQTDKKINELEAEKLRLGSAWTSELEDQLRVEKEKLKLYGQQNIELKKQRQMYKDALKDSNKLSLTAGAALKTSFNLFKGFSSNLKSWGLFDIEKSIKTSAMSMGVLSSQADGFRKNIVDASKKTSLIGVTTQDLAKIQADYSEELGRSVQLNEKSLVAMGQLSKFADLGAEGAARMAADMDKQGISAEKTGEFMNQTLADSHALGLNASKVIKNIAGNVKMLNKYRFKDGIKGLAKMAMTASKLGVDMEFASGMADKLFDIEGAVDMSAQLQVMGGAWAQMADPFHLMYMARNDMEGLTEEIANAAKQSMSFAKDGSIEMSAMEMHRLKIVAQQTGLEYDKLVEAGKAAFKLSKTKAQVGGVSPELQEFIANTAEFKDGKATIMVNGNKKLLSSLSEQDKKTLEAQRIQKEDMKQRAEDALVFDEALNNVINGMKIYLLPIVKAIDEKLLPRLKSFSDKFEKGKWGDKLESLATSIGKFMAGVGETIFGIIDVLGPEGTLLTALALWGGAKTLTWIANGFALAQGFNMGVKGFGGGFGGGGGSAGFGTRNMAAMNRMAAMGKLSTMGKFGANFKGAAGSTATRLGGLAAGGFAAYNEYGEQIDKGKSAKSAFGRAALKGTGAGLGAWGGASAGAAIGAFGGPLAPITVPLGALIGGGLGAWGGGELADLDNYGVQDGYFAGSNSRRAILQQGKITPIDKKDDLIAMKPNGVVDNYNKEQSKKGSDTLKVEHGEMSVNGNINLNIPGSNAIALEVMKTSAFQAEVARMVNSQIEKNKNQKTTGS